MASPAKIPASITNKSREELEQFLVGSLTKLKARDKRIDDLTKASAAAEDKVQEAIMERDSAAAETRQIEATVAALQAKLLSSEEAFNVRLAAETEFLNGQLEDLRTQVQKATAAVDVERENCEALQEQLSSRESLIAQLQDSALKADTREASLRETVVDLQRQVEQTKAASEAAWAEERFDLEKACTETVEKAVQDAKKQVQEAAAVEVQEVQGRLDAANEEIGSLQAEKKQSAADVAALPLVSSGVVENSEEREEDTKSGSEYIKKVEELENELAAVKGGAQTTLLQVEQLQTELKTAQTEVKNKSREVVELQAQLSALEKSVAAEKEATTSKATASIEAAEDKVVAAETAAAALQQQLNEMKSTMEASVATAAEKQEAATAALQTAHSTAATAAQTEIAALQEKIAGLEKDGSALSFEVERLQTALQAAQSDLVEEQRKSAAAASAAATANSTPSSSFPSPVKSFPSESSIDYDATVPLPNIGDDLPPLDADPGLLRAECERLVLELTDAKRKFLAAAKKKKEEMTAKIADMEERVAVAEAETAAAKEAAAAATAAAVPATAAPPPPPSVELKRAAEVARAEVAQIRKEVETERARFKRAIAESKRRLDAVSREKENSDAATATAQSAIEGLRAELSAVQQRATTAQRDAETAADELKDYKARAHALLKAKEVEIREAKSVALEEQSAALHSAEAAAAAAEAAAAAAQQELESVKRKAAEELTAAIEERDIAAAMLKKEAQAATTAAAAANRQYEQVKLRYESLETRTQLLQEQLNASTAAAADVQQLQNEIESLREQHTLLQESSATALHAKDVQLDAAKDSVAACQEQITSLQLVIDGFKAGAAARAAALHSSADTTANYQYNGDGSYDAFPASSLPSSSPTTAVTAAELKAKEEELIGARRYIGELQREVEDLEQEVHLHGKQASALKEAVRELQRELERVKLASTAVDMEYFKNVMLKLFETGEAESLLPVVSTVLKFSPAETSRCKKALEERTANYIAAVHGGSGSGGGAQEGMSSYFTNWMS